MPEHGDNLLVLVLLGRQHFLALVPGIVGSD
jgi:hypothetical protein